MCKGFTLIELIVVIAIIAILAAIIAPNAFKAIEKAKVAAAKSDVATLKKAALLLYTDTGKFPKGCPPYAITTSVALQAIRGGLVVRPEVYFDAGTGCGWTQNEVDSWDGPYIDAGQAVDPWKGIYWLRYDYNCNNATINNACPEGSSVSQVCESICPDYSCQIAVIRSKGPDQTIHTCDDVLAAVGDN
ncbi:MAG: type II secretion system protein GspG [Candidatus Omnitrophica bacterium]|nr:type II secretion system protein GspG [Candidatus Omnitrophota bacterium]MBU2045075.1 type II secretion system protein GspG [Candidatus Omnitrophota bacterium]MBU2251058.1 type II secretion system protein GspG [Candidatus Omnitrophota bacterium]MBU2265763.1 type II secretion system protein GspG [Candidatus Omnitrophota bacterium]MBU2473188.1 type II secretion system protein GspG [Candidatus Omnitrophota bacterium]